MDLVSHPTRAEEMVNISVIWNTWNHTAMWELIVLDRNMWYHITVYKKKKKKKKKI